jgi:hypothetical protein
MPVIIFHFHFKNVAFLYNNVNLYYTSNIGRSNIFFVFFLVFLILYMYIPFLFFAYYLYIDMCKKKIVCLACRLGGAGAWSLALGPRFIFTLIYIIHKQIT